MDAEALIALARADRITQTLDLGEFHERFAGQTAEILLNPTRKQVKEADLDTAEGRLRFVGMLIGLTNEQADRLFEGDNSFGGWLVNHVLDAYYAYAAGSKKKDSSGGAGAKAT